jgi:hypothetical protein
MKFRYQITNTINPILKGFEYETIFQDNNGDWRSIEREFTEKGLIFPIVEAIQKRIEVSNNSLMFKNDTFFNYYEHEIDITILQRNKIAARALWYAIKAEEQSEVIREVAASKEISREMRLDLIYKKDTGFDLRREIAILIPELYPLIPRKMFDCFNTFKFLLRLNNDLFKEELKQYNSLINEQIKEQIKCKNTKY